MGRPERKESTGAGPAGERPLWTASLLYSLAPMLTLSKGPFLFYSVREGLVGFLSDCHLRR